jgi:hypothetical protein
MIACLLIVLLFNRKETESIKDIRRLIFIAGTGWFLCFLLPTLFIPVRSDIYVYIPQVGVHLVALPIIFYLWKKISLSIRKKLNQVIAFLPVGISILIYIVSFVSIASVNGEKGKSSSVFIQQVLQCTSKIKTGAHTYIIDMQPGREFSPSRIFSYGFAAMLHLYFPDKYLTGEIIPPGNVDRIKCNKKMLNFFSWGDGRLTGPLGCTGLKTAISFLHPYSYLIPRMPGKPEKRRTKRLYRLKKRKMRLKQQNIEKK